MAEYSMLRGVHHDLGGRTLRMATLQWAPFVMRHQNETSTWYTGLCIDVLHILSEALNFTYTITEPADGSYGQKLPNGTWIGLTGLLYNKEVDFALAAAAVTEERATVSDYTPGYYFDEIVMITTRPQPFSMTLDFFFRPFHWLVFLLLGCALVMVILLYVWFERCEVSYGVFICRRRTKDNKDESVVSVAEAGQTVFGMLLGRAVAYKRTSKTSKALLYSWLLMSLVTVASYTGKLTSNSLLIQEPVPFTSLRELVQRTDYRWGLVKGGRIEALFSSSTDEDYQLYYKAVQKFAAEDPSVLASDLNTILQNILTGKYVQVTIRSTYDFLKERYCQLALVPERLFQDPSVVYLQKGSAYTRLFVDVHSFPPPLRTSPARREYAWATKCLPKTSLFREVNRQPWCDAYGLLVAKHHLELLSSTRIDKAAEMGFLHYFKQKWFPPHPDCNDDQTTIMTVSLELVQMAFFIGAAGLFLAFLGLALECLTAKCYSQTSHKNA